MSLEGNKAVLRRVFDTVWNQGNLDVVDELFAPDYVLHNPSAPETRGADALKQLVTGYRRAFPDLRFTVLQEIAEGDWVAARWEVTGTHQGEMMGIPATGKRVAVRGMSMVRIQDGKMAEDFGSIDMLGMMQQLGAIPTMG